MGITEFPSQAPAQPVHTVAGGDSPPPTHSAVAPYTDIAELAAKTASKAHFMGEVLRYVTRFFSSPYAALHVQFGPEVLQDDFHVGSTHPNFWKASVQGFMTHSLGARRPQVKLLKAKRSDARAAFISAPTFDETGSTIGSLALVLAPVRQEDLPYRIATLEAMLGLAGACLTRFGAIGANQAVSPVSVSPGRATAVAGLSRFGDATSAVAVAFAITNELRNRFGFEQVALGMVSGQRVRLLSVSGLDHVNERSPGVRDLVGAMEECLDANEPISYPTAGTTAVCHGRSAYRLHQQWHAATQGDAVASVPVSVAGRTVAILSLRHRVEQIFAREPLLNVRVLVEQYAPALLLARRASRSLPGHVRDCVCGATEVFTRPGRWGKKVVAGIALVGSAWFLFGSLSYRPTVPCRAVPSEVRHLAAPFEGTLATAEVVDGDSVRRGQVLCTFDQRDTEQKIAELSAELAVLEHEDNRAMAKGQPVESQVARAKQELTRSRLAIARRRAEQAVLRAPFDGLVVAGDLRKSIGRVLSKGDPLYDVAPAGGQRLELAVPQRIASEVKKGMQGVFISYARPEDAHVFQITHLRSSTADYDGKSVYIAEAALLRGSAWLRPGMEGAAKIHVGRRAAWWVTLHGVIDWLRLRFWL